MLALYTIQLRELTGTRPQIVLINNSSMPVDRNPPGLLGVLHHAVIPQPMRDQQRIVNSTMLVSLDPLEDALVLAGDEEAFVATDRVSGSSYQSQSRQRSS